MSIPLSGAYRIRNVKYPNQMFDLRGGSSSAGTPVIGFTNNTKSQNMLWTLQVLDANHKTIRLVNVASGTFAQGGSSGEGVVGSPSAAVFKLSQRSNVGEYSIQTTDGKLACCLVDAKNYTPVTLHNVDNHDNGQGWIFCPA